MCHNTAADALWSTNKLLWYIETVVMSMWLPLVHSVFSVNIWPEPPDLLSTAVKNVLGILKNISADFVNIHLYFIMYIYIYINIYV